MKYGKRTAIVLAFLLVPTLSAASARPSQEKLVEMARAGLETRLLDAQSARIRDINFSATDPADNSVCGLVNAKNLHGAYTGYKAFIGMFIGMDGWKDPKEAKEMVYVIGLDSGDAETVRGMCRSQGIPMSPA